MRIKQFSCSPLNYIVEKQVNEYANACRVYDTRKNAPKVYGSVSIESAKYKRDKAYADLFGK